MNADRRPLKAPFSEPATEPTSLVEGQRLLPAEQGQGADFRPPPSPDVPALRPGRRPLGPGGAALAFSDPENRI